MFVANSKLQAFNGYFILYSNFDLYKRGFKYVSSNLIDLKNLEFMMQLINL